MGKIGANRIGSWLAVGLSTGAALLCVISATGCEEKKKQTTADVPKAEEQALIDPNLGRALAATSASAAAAKPAGDSDAPPELGIFTAEQADAIHKKEAALHVDVGVQGSEPYIDLAATVPALPKTTTFMVATMLGPRVGLPSLDFVVSWKPEAGAANKAQGVGLTDLVVQGSVTKSGLSAQQPGQLPENVAKAVGELKASQLTWTMLAQVGAQVTELKPSKNAKPELVHPLYAVAEAITQVSLPSPGKPVGVGGTWLARSRDTFGGLDVISYRMIRITNIDTETVTYAVNTRQYSVGNQVEKPGIEPGTKLMQFESSSEGEFTIQRGHRFARRGSLTHVLVMVLGSSEEQAQARPVMFQSTVKFPVGE